MASPGIDLNNKLHKYVLCYLPGSDGPDLEPEDYVFQQDGSEPPPNFLKYSKPDPRAKFVQDPVCEMNYELDVDNQTTQISVVFAEEGMEISTEGNGKSDEIFQRFEEALDGDFDRVRHNLLYIDDPEFT